MATCPIWVTSSKPGEPARVVAPPVERGQRDGLGLVGIDRLTGSGPVEHGLDVVTSELSDEGTFAARVCIVGLMRGRPGAQLRGGRLGVTGARIGEHGVVEGGQGGAGLGRTTAIDGCIPVARSLVQTTAQSRSIW
jgi:hypothetical protein